MIPIATNEIIKLHHDALHTIVEFDTWDTRLINSTLNGRNQKVLVDTESLFPVDLQIYSQLAGLETHPLETYAKAKASAIRLRDTPLEILMEGGQVLRTGVLHSVLYDDKARSLNICWNELFIPLVTGRLKKGEFLQPAIIMAELTGKRYSLYLLIAKDLWKLEHDTGFKLKKEDIKKAVGARKDQVFGEVNASFLKPVLKELYNKLGIKVKVRVGRSDTVEIQHYV